MRKLLLADLYEGNPITDGKRLASVVDGVFLKVSEGMTWNDPTFVSRRQTLNAYGARVGFYHYAHPHLNSPEHEAMHFATRIGTLHRRDLRPALDMEEPEALKMNPRDVEKWIRAWNHCIYSMLHVWPLFYSYPDFIHRLNLSKPVGYGLWLAQYNRNDGRDYGYQVPHPWKKVLLHQFSSVSRLPGTQGKVDLNHATKLRGLLANPVRGLA